jgi:hypothetical protein
VQPLGGQTTGIVNETAANRSRQLTSNSLIVEGGTMEVVPVSNSTAITPRPVNARCVSTGSQRHRSSGQQPNSLSNSRPEISHFMEAMNASNRSLFRRSIKEILEDYDLVKNRLAQARSDDDAEALDLYNNLRKNLEAELQSSV